MGVFDFLSTNKKQSLSLIIDIGSSSVCVGVVLLHKHKKLEILSTRRIPLAVPEQPDLETFIPRIISFLEKTLVWQLSLIKKYGRVDHVHCFYSAPWYLAETKHVHVREKTPFKITQSFFDDMLEKEREAFLGKRNMMQGGQARISEKTILDVRLNGYPTNEPVGKSASEVDFSIFLSTLREKLVSSVEATIDTHVHAKHVAHHSFVLASYSSVLDLFPHDNTFVFVDITGEITDMYVVRNDVLEALHSFPSGRNLLIRSVMQHFDVTSAVAVSYLTLFFSGEADPEFAQEIDGVIQTVREEWNIYYTDGLREMSKTKAIPDKVFMTIDDDMAPFFSKIVKDPVVLNDKNLASFVTHKKVVIPDPFIVLESLYVNKLY